MDLQTAIGSLNRTDGWSQLPREAILAQITDIQNAFSALGHFELQFALGAALQYYVALFVRGDSRKPLLKRAVLHLEQAFQGAIGKKWEFLTHLGRERPDVFIAGVLGSCLIEEAVVRDLRRGTECLEHVWKATSHYDPALCRYVDALYKQGDFAEAARVGVALHERALRDPNWRSSPPPYPLKAAAKAYRAEARRLMKVGQLREAHAHLGRLLDTGYGSESDERLRRSVELKLASGNDRIRQGEKGDG